jgi:hypothetical protein
MVVGSSSTPPIDVQSWRHEFSIFDCLIYLQSGLYSSRCGRSCPTPSTRLDVLRGINIILDRTDQKRSCSTPSTRLNADRTDQKRSCSALSTSCTRIDVSEIAIVVGIVPPCSSCATAEQKSSSLSSEESCLLFLPPPAPPFSVIRREYNL